MRSNIFSRSRRWMGASALAIIAALGGASAMVATGQATAFQPVQAQVQPAAQITVPTIAEPASFADLVDAVKPAVVSILIEGEAPGERMRGGGGGGPGFDFNLPDLPDDHPLKRFFDQFGGRGGQGESEAPPRRRFQAAGSGFAITADGYFVTNNHVVDNASKVTVVFDNGDEREATVVGTDERTDLAVVKVDGLTDQPYVQFAESDVRVGDWVMAVGNPFGLGGTVTVGIVSARGRDIGGSSYGDFLQIDAAVNTGNSGGPTFNLAGEVVGVNTAIFSPNGGNVGIAFAIPAATVKAIAEQLISTGTVTRGYLGVAIQDVNRDIADSVGLANPRGALVTEPSADAPAAQAGIVSGDIITQVDGDTIDNALDLSRTIAGKPPGTVVELTVWRDNAEQKIKVTLGQLSEQEAATEEEPAQPAEPAAPAVSSVGLTLVPNADGPGLLVQGIEEDSVAATKGFAVGDSILSVDNKDVASIEEFEAAIKAVRDSGRTTALIKASRGGNIRFIGLPLEAN